MREILSIVCVSMLLLSAFASHALARDQFAGKWKVEVLPDEDARRAGERKFDDTLLFEGGFFSSAVFKKRGFDRVQFEEDVRRGPIASFKAAAESEKQGAAHWSGTVTADQIKGELVWTKADGTELRYSFQGSRAQE
jgi:hypothetical protein